MTTSLQPGKLVSLRGRDWVVLPSDDPDLLVVKPLGGSEEEIAGIYLPLAIPEDTPRDACFDPPPLGLPLLPLPMAADTRCGVIYETNALARSAGCL